MKTKETKIKKTLEKLLSMQVIGYIVYPSVILWDDEMDEEDSEKFSIDYSFNHYEEKNLLFWKVRDAYDALFMKVIEKSGRRYLINDNKSTIVLEGVGGKRLYFHKHDNSFTLSDGGIRQGWDYEFDPTASKEENKKNHFFQKNLWF